MHTSFSKSILAVGALATVVACSSDTSPKALKGPDGASCTQGTITANGPAVSGTISPTSDCFLPDAYDGDTAYAASYAMAVTAGKIYSVTATGSGVDSGGIENLLIGSTAADTEVLVAASSENFSAGANVLWFYAPTSGTYSLRALNYDTKITNMSYTMQVHTCPVIATVAVSDTDYVDSTSSLAASGCKEEYTFFAGDSSYVNYYLVDFGPGQTRWFQVLTSAFTPGWGVGGPNFDSMWDFAGDNGATRSGSGQWGELTADTAGTYTVYVGSTTYAQTGAYRLNIFAPSLVPSRVPGPPLQSQTVHLSGRQRLHSLR